MPKKRRIIIVVLSLLLLLALIWGLIAVLFPVKFYNDFPFRLVSKETKAFVKSLYREYSDSLQKVWVAEDNRSYVSVRFVFFSEELLPQMEQAELLEKVRNELQFRMDEAQAQGSWCYQECIEAFFCIDQEVYAVYAAVSAPSLEVKRVREYSPWERIPKAEAVLDVSLVERMMKRTSVGMFREGYDLPPLSECKPYLPPYVGDDDYQEPVYPSIAEYAEELEQTASEDLREFYEQNRQLLEDIVSVFADMDAGKCGTVAVGEYEDAMCVLEYNSIQLGGVSEDNPFYVPLEHISDDLPALLERYSEEKAKFNHDPEIGGFLYNYDVYITAKPEKEISFEFKYCTDHYGNYLVVELRYACDANSIPGSSFAEVIEDGWYIYAEVCYMEGT